MGRQCIVLYQFYYIDDQFRASQAFQFKAHLCSNGDSLSNECNAEVECLRSSLCAGFNILYATLAAFDIESLLASIICLAYSMLNSR